MPIYVYVCDECGSRFEEICSIAAGERRLNSACSQCGVKLERPIGENAPTVHMRGYSPAHPRFFRGMRK